MRARPPIASASFSGSLPPAWAIVSRPPPPPPATSRGDLDDLARLDAALRPAPARPTATRAHACRRRRAEHDRGVAERVLDAVGRVEQRLGVGDLDDARSATFAPSTSSAASGERVDVDRAVGAGAAPSPPP